MASGRPRFVVLGLLARMPVVDGRQNVAEQFRHGVGLPASASPEAIFVAPPVVEFFECHGLVLGLRRGPESLRGWGWRRWGGRDARKKQVERVLHLAYRR